MIPIKKLKSLLPSLREKKRYVAFEVLSEDNTPKDTIKKLINESCLSYLGELNTAKAGIMFLDDVYKNNKGIIKTSVKSVNELKACLSLIKEKQIRSLVTSGMINKVEALIAS